MYPIHQVHSTPDERIRRAPFSVKTEKGSVEEQAIELIDQPKSTDSSVGECRQWSFPFQSCRQTATQKGGDAKRGRSTERETQGAEATSAMAERRKAIGGRAFWAASGRIVISMGRLE